MSASIESLFAEFPFDDVLRRIGKVAMRERIEVYAVGGVVRDVLLGRMTTDIDFVSVGPGSGIRLAEALVTEMGGTIVHVYKNFGTAAIRVGHPATKDQLVHDLSLWCERAENSGIKALEQFSRTLKAYV